MSQPNSSDSRGQAIHDHLVQVHALYRRQLTALRQSVDDWLVDGGDPQHVTAAAQQFSPDTVGQDLRVHCMHFCQALTAHHSIEDEQMFPALRRAYASSGPLIDRLETEHRQIADLVAELASLADQLSTSRRSVSAVAAALTRLADKLEAHLDYEEDSLAPLFRGAVS